MFFKNIFFLLVLSGSVFAMDKSLINEERQPSIGYINSTNIDSNGFFHSTPIKVFPLLDLISDKPLEEIKRNITEFNVDWGDETYCTALHYAARNNDLELVKYLVEECKADINLVNDSGCTAFLCAVEEGSFDIIIYLLESANANIHDKDKFGNNALHLAVFKNQPEVLKYLIDKIDVNAKNEEGVTPLQIAIDIDDILLFQILIKKSDITIKNKQGKTAYDLIKSKMMRDFFDDYLETQEEIRKEEFNKKLSLNGQLEYFGQHLDIDNESF